MILKLLLLDWRSLDIYRYYAMLMIIVSFIFGIIYSILLIPYGVFFALTFSVNTFYVEDKFELNKLSLILPVSRKNIVLARYTFCFILVLLCITISASLMPVVRIYSLSKWYFDWGGYAALIALGILIFSIFNLAMYPFLFKLGYKKGKILGYFIPCAFFGILFIAYLIVSNYYPAMTIEFISFASDNLLLVSGGMIAAAVVLLLLSFYLSLRIYSRRDF